MRHERKQIGLEVFENKYIFLFIFVYVVSEARIITKLVFELPQVIIDWPGNNRL